MPNNLLKINRKESVVNANSLLAYKSIMGLKPAAHIQDCQEDSVTTANRGAILRKCQDYWSFKTASRQPPDSFQMAARLPYDGYDSVVTVL